MTEPINPQAVMDFLKPRMGARFKTWVEICTHCGMCADTCHFYLANNKNPKMIPAYKVRFLKDLLKKKGRVDRAYLEEVYKTVYYECNVCRRCSLYCPFGIDIAFLIYVLRALLTSQGLAPEGLARTVIDYKEFGNQMAVPDDEWIETLQWCEEETSEELVGLKIPIDKKGAKILYTVNAREPKYYPQDIMEMAKIFHVAGEDWTFPGTRGWDATNLAMFMSDLETAKEVVSNTFKRAEELEVEQIVVTECGHAYRALCFEAPIWLGYTPKKPVIHSVELFLDYLKEGRIRLKEKVKEPTTLQDPCNIIRNGGLAEKNRLLAAMVSEDFRPMKNQGNYNFCCGGGGGAMPMGGEMKKHRLASGRVKADQIRETGAKIVLVPCHNCIDQIRDLIAEYKIDAKAVHFKEVIAEHMVIPEEMIPKDDEE